MSSPTPTPPESPAQAAAPAPAAFDPNDEVLVSLYAASKKLYPRAVDGLFAKWRWALVWLTQIVFYLTPWLNWGERQAVLFDLDERRFYILGLVLYPQDFIYLTGLLVISALSLFLFTAVAGRLWCGYACPQTVYTEIFLWIERKIEGDRSARMRLDDASMNANKALKKWSKHAVWILFALWTGITFVGFFSPIRSLMGDILAMRLGAWETFWVLFYGLATYGNAGFLREQICKYMCPYARFQSAMFDRDTLIVSYDEARGEPRGRRSKKADIKLLGLGECVDCSLCVQVCPTGIDIRKGLQYECIGCGACADVCDDVMDKVGYPRGLVRYTTQNAMQAHWTRSETLRHIFRPRVLVYSSLLGLIVVAVAVSLYLRIPFKVDVVRDRGTMARLVQGGQIENIFRLQLMNATEKTQVYRLKVQGLNGVQIMGDTDITVDPAKARWVPVRVQLPMASVEPGSHPFEFTIDALDAGQRIVEKSVFLVPR